jgi:hypothetical protein
MHDIFIALLFVGMVTYPALVSALPTPESEKEPLPAVSPSQAAEEDLAAIEEVA